MSPIRQNSETTNLRVLQYWYKIEVSCCKGCD